MLEIIVNNTNRNVQKLMREKTVQMNSIKYPYLKLTIIDEIRALIGLMYYHEIYNLSGHRRNILFSDDKGLPMFGAIMSQNRFKFLTGNISFDDASNRGRCWQHDRLQLFENF